MTRTTEKKNHTPTNWSMQIFFQCSHILLTVIITSHVRPVTCPIFGNKRRPTIVKIEQFTSYVKYLISPPLFNV